MRLPANAAPAKTRARTAVKPASLAAGLYTLGVSGPCGQDTPRGYRRGSTDNPTACGGRPLCGREPRADHHDQRRRAARALRAARRARRPPRRGARAAGAGGSCSSAARPGSARRRSCGRSARSSARSGCCGARATRCTRRGRSGRSSTWRRRPAASSGRSSRTGADARRPRHRAGRRAAAGGRRASWCWRICTGPTRPRSTSCACWPVASSRCPALVLATYRDDELDRAHPLRIVLGELPRQRDRPDRAGARSRRARSPPWPARRTSTTTSCIAGPPATRSS